MNIADEAFGKIVAIQERWPNLGEGHFRIRMSPSKYKELVYLAAPGLIAEELADLPEFAPLYRQSLRERQEYIDRALANMGKKGATLFGWPVIVDDEFEGLEAEVWL